MRKVMTSWHPSPGHTHEHTVSSSSCSQIMWMRGRGSDVSRVKGESEPRRVRRGVKEGKTRGIVKEEGTDLDQVERGRDGMSLTTSTFLPLLIL